MVPCGARQDGESASGGGMGRGRTLQTRGHVLKGAWLDHSGDGQRVRSSMEVVVALLKAFMVSTLSSGHGVTHFIR